ncbi:hypothetical protein RHSIM_Rhsim04G0158300 [Rhododendron simsii]|uniref:Transposase MuDR plant domain-containing protein n=1 Tax=Rhododendron simsii TaxID=118357 RepID=A0A834H4U8_RHOSS|nr:hypothetical protein RHSIM_Rhsim04G0158300 [Rhododendron simsii]
MKILCSKFSELRRHSLQLFYAISDHPSTMLYNDEDLEVMFAVADSIGLNCKEDDLGAMFCLHQQQPRLSDAWKELITSVGQLFVGGSEGFRDALRKYSIVHSFEFDFVKNETERVTAVCKVKSCKWNIHARLDKVSGCFYIKRYYSVHSCGVVGRTTKNCHANSTLISQLIKDDVRDKSKKCPVDVVDDLKEYYGVDGNLRTALASTNVKYKEILIRVFSKCAYAPTVAKFNQHMGNLLKHGGAAVVHFLSELPNERWANVFFPGQCYGAMSSSLTECFNSWILKERELPMVDMVDRIRKKMMKSIADIFEVDTDPSRYFHVESYRQDYSKPIYPVASLWKDDVVDCGTSILPPLSKKAPGRPKKKRMRSIGEKVREMKYGRCGKLGNHNKLTCKEDLRPGF